MTPYHKGGENAALPQRQPSPSGMTRPLSLALLLCAFLIGAPAGPGFSHLTVLYTSCGYDSMMVAGLIAYLGFMICVGKIICGQVYDMVGGVLGNYYTCGVYLASFLLCCTAPLGSKLLPYLTITLFGLGIPLGTNAFAIWARDLYGDQGYESAVRSFTASMAFGMLVFGPVPGILADITGSYVPAYILFAVTLVISLTIVQYAYAKLKVGGLPSRHN